MIINNQQLFHIVFHTQGAEVFDYIDLDNPDLHYYLQESLYCVILTLLLRYHLKLIHELNYYH